MAFEASHVHLVWDSGVHCSGSLAQQGVRHLRGLEDWVRWMNTKCLFPYLVRLVLVEEINNFPDKFLNSSRTLKGWASFFLEEVHIANKLACSTEIETCRKQEKENKFSSLAYNPRMNLFFAILPSGRRKRISWEVVVSLEAWQARRLVDARPLVKKLSCRQI